GARAPPPPGARLAGPVRVAQQHERRPERPGQSRRDLVGVDVADHAILVEGERGDDWDLPAIAEAPEPLRARTGDGRHAAELGNPLGDEQPAIDPGQADRADSQLDERGNQLLVDKAADNRARALERVVTGHAADTVPEGFAATRVMH